VTLGGTGARSFGDVFTIPLRGGPPRLIAQKVGRFDQLTDDERDLVWQVIPTLSSNPHRIFTPFLRLQQRCRLVFTCAWK
jgi:hypothetical protein